MWIHLRVLRASEGAASSACRCGRPIFWGYHMTFLLLTCRSGTSCWQRTVSKMAGGSFRKTVAQTCACLLSVLAAIQTLTDPKPLRLGRVFMNNLLKLCFKITWHITSILLLRVFGSWRAWLRRLIAGSPLQRLEFDPRSRHVGFVVYKVVLVRLLSNYFCVPCPFSFHQLLCIH